MFVLNLQSATLPLIGKSLRTASTCELPRTSYTVGIIVHADERWFPDPVGRERIR